MAIKLKYTDTFSTYFIAFTCVEWIQLFDITNSYDLVYRWFYIIKKEKHSEIVAYVVMPNHLHAIIYFHESGFDLNAIVGNGKRFMAYEIIKRLKAANKDALVLRLEKLVSLRERYKGQLRRVFNDSFVVKTIFSNDFLMQKINYIHMNPVSGKWMLVNDFTDYEVSSASIYEKDFIRLFEPMHYMDL